MAVHSTKIVPFKRGVIFALICFSLIIVVGPVLDYNNRKAGQELLNTASIAGEVQNVEENTPTVPGQEKRGPGRSTVYDITVVTQDGDTIRQSTKKADTFQVGDAVKVYQSDDGLKTAIINERNSHSTLEESNKNWTIGWIVAAGISLVTIPVFWLTLKQRISRAERLQQRKEFWNSTPVSR